MADIFFGKFSELIVAKKTTEQPEKKIKTEVPREKKTKSKTVIIFSLVLIVGIVIYYLSWIARR